MVQVVAVTQGRSSGERRLANESLSVGMSLRIHHLWPWK